MLISNNQKRPKILSATSKIILARKQKQQELLSIKKKKIISIPIEPRKLCFDKQDTFEIFAYCSKNYSDAFNFVMPSWSRCESVSKITVYTDWNYTYSDNKVEIIPMFQNSSDWIVGTGRRLDVIKKYSEDNGVSNKQVLFLDIDCYLVRNVLEVFNYEFDIAISRLNSKESHTNQTATAGLWFARLNDGYFNFIDQWFKTASDFKRLGIGLQKYHISYVQYSFTQVAKQKTNNYDVMPIDENKYNSEHTLENKWIEKIIKYKPSILHYKGRRFRDIDLVKKTLTFAGEYEHSICDINR